MTVIHLRPVNDAASDESGKIDAVFFVVQRQNGHWSPAAKIITVFDNEHDAEQSAMNFKILHPQQHYGVASLRSEARQVPNPIEIVRASGDPPPFTGDQVAT